MTIFAFEDVDVGYGRTPVLKGVSLDITEGEIVSLIGRNGVGKTTLMKAAIGLLQPTNGAITYRDQNITKLPPERRAAIGIGYVPQGREIFPRLTVEENLRIGTLVNQDQSNDLFEEVYGYFPRLEERRHQRAGTMSGGEQQMLSIGRALVGGPQLLLLDEVSEGIQPTIIQEIAKAIQVINDELGTTILFVEQNLEFTIQTTERCYVMEKGRIVTELDPGDLRDAELVQKYITV